MSQSAWTPVPLDQAGWTPVPTQPVAPPAEKSLLQKAQDKFDAFTNVTPDQEKGHSAIVNRAQEFGAGAVQGAFAPIVHPLDTLNGIGSAIAHPVNTATAMIQQAKDHPAQALGNLVGGAVTGQLAGEAAAPITSAAARGIGRASDAIGVPQKLFESAAKPSTTLAPAERAAVAKTAIQNEIPVTPDGVHDLMQKINSLNQANESMIAADPTRQISTAPATAKLQSVRSRFQNQVAPTDDLEAIDRVGSDFSAQAPNGSLPAAQAQSMKQGTYQAIGSKAYGELKGASTEAQKAVASGLKDELARQFPELNANNQQLSKLYDLQPVLERAVNREANHQLMGLSGPLTGLAVEALTGHPAAAVAAGLLKGVIDSAEFKSKLAIALSKAGNIPISAANAKVAAYSRSLGAYTASANATGQQPNNQVQ